MVLLIFKGGKEYLKLNLSNREKIMLASSLTNYQFKDVSSKFYDSQDEKDRCSKLSEDAFRAHVCIQFLRQGYKLIQKVD